jgi:ABC-type antimicrobial peptide transport system permease subunit
MNLNKFSKAELISKIKGLQNNPKTQSKLLAYLNIIKSLILKITFLALIIKIFKQFKIIRRLYLIINTIAISIFGISMMDLYGLSIFSALFAEITQITGNIISYLRNTKVYSYLIGWLGYKIENPTKFESATRIQQEIPRNEIEIKLNSKIASWFEKEQEIIEEEPFYKNKYFIYGSFLLISCVTYYYFGDEIKLLTVSTWEWLRGRRPGDNPPPINPPVNPSSESTRMNPIATFFGLNKNKAPKGVSLDEIIGEDSIEVMNSTDEYFTEPKGKDVVNLQFLLLQAWNL